MKTFDFKNRLFLAYAAVTIGIVLLFGVLLIWMTSSQNRETELMHQQEVFEGNLRQIEAMVTQANRLATQVSTSNEVLSLFIALSAGGHPDGGGENYFSDELMDKIRVDSLLAGVNGVDGFADRISVFNRYGDYVSTGRLYETPASIQASLEDVRGIDEVTKRVEAQPERFLITGLKRDAWSNNPNASFFTLYRTLSYTAQSASYGLVSVQLQAERLKSLDFWGEENSTEYFLIDDSRPGAVERVYPVNGARAVDEMYRAIEGHIAQAADENKRMACLDYASGGTEYKLLAARVNLGNWILMRALPTGELTRPYRGNYAVMVGACLILMVIFLIVVNYMAERISRPLRHLASSIGGINLQNMRLGTEEARQEYSTHELIALDDAFRSMLSRLDDSIALEMQAYMRVLQSQMNPHFLYNMLSVIIASSEAAEDERTVSMCLKLSAMLRYIADFSRDRVPLADELEHARNYLELMKDRYEDLFAFDIDLADEAAAVVVPKLTVQPLAENCFMHGFKNDPPWHIAVRVRAEEGRWWLTVEDNGVGMTEDEVKALIDRMESYRENVADKYQELTLGGMGLINTLLRLSLVSSAGITYTIANRVEGGLRVEIGGMIDDPRSDR